MIQLRASKLCLPNSSSWVACPKCGGMMKFWFNAQVRLRAVCMTQGCLYFED